MSVQKRAYLILYSSVTQVAFFGIRYDGSIMLFGGGMTAKDSGNFKICAYREARQETSDIYNGSRYNYQDVLADENGFFAAFKEDYAIDLAKIPLSGNKECKGILTVPLATLKHLYQTKANMTEFAKGLVDEANANLGWITPMKGHEIKQVNGKDFTHADGWFCRDTLYQYAGTIP